MVETINISAAKLVGFSKTRKGTRMSFEIDPADIPAELQAAHLDTCYAMVLVETDLNGTPAKPEISRPNKLVQRAGILCNEQMFKNFIKHKYHDDCEMDTAAVVRNICGISSRSELATNNDAAAKFHQLLASFEMWRRGE
jgi:hypothetical protein